NCKRGQKERTRRDRLSPQICRNAPTPRLFVRDVISGAGHSLFGFGNEFLKIDRRIVGCVRPHIHRVSALKIGAYSALVGAYVVELGTSPLFGFSHDSALAANQSRYGRFGIVEISGDYSLFRADYNARGLQPDLNAMSAEVAFLRRVGIRIDVERVVRASLHAAFTTDAIFGIEIHDSVFALEQCSDRTDCDARRVVAMIATQHGEMALGIR